DLGADGKDSRKRCIAAFKLDICGRRSQLAAEFLPVHDTPSDAEWSAKQPLRQLQITIGQCLPKPAAADTNTIDLDGPRGFDGETLDGTGLEQKVKITGTVTTETEVVADFQMAHAQPFNQGGMHEFGSAQFTQASIECQAQHQIHALLTQQTKLFAQPCEPRRGFVPCKEFPGLGFENHHTAGHPQFGRTLAQALQDGLMPPMHSVEIADGGHAPPMPGPQVVNTSNQLHTALLA